MKTVEVVAAVIMEDQKVLATQRGQHKYNYISNKYEFPGGKVEKGETEEVALVREIKEELGMEIEVNQKLITVNHTYPDFKIIMHTYLCKRRGGEIKLYEHQNYQWLSPDDLYSVDWAMADVPIVKSLTEKVL
ncbi:(deoxy)nucleoside triphosphate pyrophosphohydrolase [Isachenkonia alkalipeptolytica]|uniref:8-oxo-dGTP diphosphatase n=1 Tax=Isachenkonia alkalipeptolytica TaxID=2565777 RepID=A0AA43XMG0_9CLOT|nr:(deoxy)nucleoside triphosphate pyrophosphohydrolase [Isachenkonia alkalipeptolytica]NBG88640.1 (deoxy)nucleoside triphosphate pyrophosphohydrolase [Isachenkonia alkalipeptolytica]